MPVFTAIRHVAARAGCAVLAALLLAGCGSPRDNGASGSGTTGSASPAASASQTAPSPSPSPSPSVQPRPTAADEKRYAACADGTCEVYLSRPVRIKVRGGTVSVTKVKADDSVDLKVTLNEGGGGSGTLKGTCGFIATFYYGGGGASKGCGASGVLERPTPIRGALSIQMVGWSSDGAAVLRLVSG